MNCKHEQNMLMGTKDGIVCRACGALFTSFSEIRPEEKPAEVKEEVKETKPKRSRKKAQT